MRHLSLLRRDHDNKCDRRQVNLKSASWTFETYGTFAPGTAKTIFFALQTSKTDNNALDIDVIYNLNLRKISPNSTDRLYYQMQCKISKAILG
jgi:hypothetical protein